MAVVAGCCERPCILMKLEASWHNVICSSPVKASSGPALCNPIKKRLRRAVRWVGGAFPGTPLTRAG